MNQTRNIFEHPNNPTQVQQNSPYNPLILILDVLLSIVLIFSLAFGRNQFAIVLNAISLALVIAVIVALFQNTYAMRLTIIWIHVFLAVITMILVIVLGIRNDQIGTLFAVASLTLSILSSWFSVLIFQREFPG